MDLDLLKAARDGEIETFKKLASSHGKILNGATEQGNTVLHQAAKFGHLNVADEAIKRNPSLILRTNDKGETAAHVAARAGYVNIVELLIRNVKAFRGARIPSMRDKYGNTPLHGAVRNNRLSVYRALSREDKMSLTLVNDIGESPLSIAIDKKWSSLAKEIIADSKETLNFTGPNGHTPLHLAVIRRDLDVMGKILEIHEGVSRKQDENKRTALHYAAATGDNKAVKLLLENNPSLANIADFKGKRPIHLAAERAKASVLLTLLLSSSPDTMELVDNQQQNILHIAAKHGNVDAVSLIMKLKEMEEVANSQDVDGNTPLHLAARHFHSNVVYKISRNHKVEIRVLNKDGFSALALVRTTRTRDMELQKHLALKALKSAYRKRKVHTDETIGQDIEVGSAAKTNIEEEEVSGRKIKEMAQTLTVVATLIATFTFTAAFTLPGGFKQDGPYEGTATDLIRKASFQAFVITDTISVTSSISAAVILFWSSSYRDTESFLDALPFAIGLTWVALVAMAGAFVTGMFAVLSRRLWLAITVSVIGCLAPAVLYVFAPLVIVITEWWSVLTLSSSSNLFENNPFVFVARLIKMRW